MPLQPAVSVHAGGYCHCTSSRGWPEPGGCSPASPKAPPESPRAPRAPQPAPHRRPPALPPPARPAAPGASARHQAAQRSRAEPSRSHPIPAAHPEGLGGIGAAQALDPHGARSAALSPSAPRRARPAAPQQHGPARLGSAQHGSARPGTTTIGLRGHGDAEPRRRRPAALLSPASAEGGRREGRGGEGKGGEGRETFSVNKFPLKSNPWRNLRTFPVVSSLGAWEKSLPRPTTSFKVTVKCNVVSLEPSFLQVKHPQLPQPVLMGAGSLHAPYI